MDSTPASLAFSRANWMHCPSRSYPWISTWISLSRRSSASSRASAQHFGAITFFHLWAWKERIRPGACPAAIMAASMGNVPPPQKGSTKIRSLFHGVSMSSAAASVSDMGALTVCFR